MLNRRYPAAGAARASSLVFARAAAYCTPAAGKKSKTGEDGFYIARNGLSLGVADGVGGCLEKGIDPAAFTRTLMHHAVDRAEEISSAEAAEAGRFTSHAIMQDAFDQVMKQNLAGSCTAVFATLERDVAIGANAAAPSSYAKPKRSNPPAGPFAVLNVANVGDCGIAVVRPGSGLVFIGQEQLRGYNYPFQLGAEAESPSDGTLLDYCVAQHDVVVLGSDGLFVNVDKEELLSCVLAELQDRAESPTLSSGDGENRGKIVDCKSLAQRLGKLARSNYLKPDDITVVVAQLEKAHEGKSQQLNQLPKYRTIVEFFVERPDLVAPG
jgi:protein phosphatase PTC7